MTRLNPASAGLEVKRTATLLRDTRAVLRRVNVLAASALTVDDPALPAIAELRPSAERLVPQVAHRDQASNARPARRSVGRANSSAASPTPCRDPAADPLERRGGAVEDRAADWKLANRLLDHSPLRVPERPVRHSG